MFSPMFRSQLQLTLLSRSSTYTSKLSMNLANAMSARDLKTYAFRLRPAERLIDSLRQFVAHKQIQAGMISTCVGSLQEVIIRFANQEEHNRMQGHFEIVSLTGTFSVAGHHVHISVSDRAGNTTGGHLIEGTVYTTAEMVVTELAGLTFGRETDDTYGFKELAIS